jgi:hypothetical protein
MAKTVTARIDDETEKALSKLVLMTQKTESQIVRDGIKLLADSKFQNGNKPKMKFYGLGEIDSGFTDLGSNKAHMKDFGR